MHNSVQPSSFLDEFHPVAPPTVANNTGSNKDNVSRLRHKERNKWQALEMRQAE
jgi:hypothetical protein